jgi:hypothetical protein
MKSEEVIITTDTSGNGTAVTTHPVNGEIRQTVIGTAFGTAHATLLHAGDLSQAYHGPGTLHPLPFPVSEDYLQVKVVGGGSKKTATVKVIYAEE